MKKCRFLKVLDVKMNKVPVHLARATLKNLTECRDFHQITDAIQDISFKQDNNKISPRMTQVDVTSPVPPSLYPTLAATLLGGGLCMTGSFFLYEVTKTKSNRALRSELLLAFISAVLLGLGTLFLLLWVGVYV